MIADVCRRCGKEITFDGADWRDEGFYAACLVRSFASFSVGPHQPSEYEEITEDRTPPSWVKTVEAGDTAANEVLVWRGKKDTAA